MRLATLPNMRVDASLNAIGGFMCVNCFYFTSSSTSLMGDGCGSLKLAKNFGGCEAFGTAFFTVFVRKHEDLSFYV